MARQTEEQILWRKWWIRIITAIVFLAVAYGFVSLAVDSGHIWQYALAIIFLVFAIKYLVFGLRHAIKR